MPRFAVTGSSIREALLNEQIACRNHAYKFGIDREEITNWKWPDRQKRGLLTKVAPGKGLVIK